MGLINNLWLLYKDWRDRREHAGERGLMRSREWPKVRREHLKKEPSCRWCGRKHFLNVHHVQPFHLNPELELNENNFITLCEGGLLSVLRFRKLTNCHLRRGHLGNWKEYNPNIKEECWTRCGKKETT